MSAKLYITATFNVAPQHADELQRAMEDLLTPTRKEAGCEYFFLYRDTEKPGRFIANDAWASQAALDEHMASPHFQAMAEVIKKFDVEVEFMKLSPLKPRV
ncbi:putative quinol monooxygenase [Acetobacteraceae bacterium ESL0709]|nr:putative quinol monooxygenase [Acetobacteraceae bacterium ESL0697]MDF7677172.1 putative quinol monooxygenase [Acetobacteraceae bacterium ESL0709]